MWCGWPLYYLISRFFFFILSCYFFFLSFFFWVKSCYFFYFTTSPSFFPFPIVIKLFSERNCNKENYNFFFLFYAVWFEKSQFTLYFMGNSNYRKICVMIILNSLVRTRSQNSQMTIINYGTHYIHIKGSA